VGDSIDCVLGGISGPIKPFVGSIFTNISIHFFTISISRRSLLRNTMVSVT
jgi:hypothetical protein